MFDYDAVVIGSGAGGLTAALALAQAGERTLVLEQHDVPGGWCHSFTLDGYRFSPGVHYIGELAPGGRMRAIYEGLGVANDMTFLELNPDGYDHVIVGDERFDIPKGKAAFADRLKARFPREAKGIDGYLGTVERIFKQTDDLPDMRGFLDLLKLPFRAPTLIRYGLSTLDSLLSRFVEDPVLRAILAAQCGDHGLGPARASAIMHAAVAAHYFDGGYYPKGGAFTIPRAFVRALKRAGGDIRLKAEVTRILVEGAQGRKRALGVRLADGTEIRARRVISNADPNVTFRWLVGSEHLSRRLKRKLRRTRYSVSALSLFLAADMDLRSMGFDSGNYWYSTTPNLDASYNLADTASGVDVEDYPGMFLTVTTLKDPSKEQGGPNGERRGHHTMEAFVLVSYDAFHEWARSKFGDRPEGYKALKAVLMKRMLRGASRIIPGLEDHVVFCDLGTPLTNEHYIVATRGNLYGTEKGRLQIGPFAFPLSTEIDGLSMCGASTLGHGVMGATVSGLALVAKLLKCKIRDLMRATGQELRIYPCDDTSKWPEEMRPRAWKEGNGKRNAEPEAPKTEEGELVV